MSTNVKTGSATSHLAAEDSNFISAYLQEIAGSIKRVSNKATTSTAGVSAKHKDKPMKSHNKAKDSLNLQEAMLKNEIIATKESIAKTYFSGKKPTLRSRRPTYLLIALVILGLGYCHYLLISNALLKISGSNEATLSSSATILLPFIIFIGYISLIYLLNSEKIRQIKAMKLIIHTDSLLKEKK